MRYAAAIVLVGLLGAGFVLHERKGVLEHHLGQVATQLVEHEVQVHCQGVAGELLDVGPELGTVQFGPDGRPSDTTNLKRPACTALRRFRADANGPQLDCVLRNLTCGRRAFDDVLAVHTLAHESWHLRGVADEAVAECKSLQTTALAAELLGADVQHAEAIARYYVQQYYPHMPREYLTPDCHDGGPFDLRPADTRWP